MTGKGSKQKGANYERHVCSVINSFFGANCGRTPCSGAMATYPGDIIGLTPPLDIFTIECKNQQKTSIFDWLNQAEREGVQAHKIPLLVFTKNYEKDYVCLSLEEFLRLMGGDNSNTYVDTNSKLDNAGPIC